ncbi:hypothetical protein ATI61_106642 [Archangium gephyra]|uniref:Uncharacterized protein n=1 Tax=Archangium gephyra TaxID=48 RepID=A0AAC8Q1P6_9BACT|nr:hypothetical protein [Archangium gephyra]AKI99267.1 Hypothetical protein AA314_00894 [Archangium gephyra]REG31172.1 hypothetical protein ATI61_106642 [Archangium gephyra]
MQSLAREVERRMQRLAEASVSELYDDPFWFARYGEERARRFGGEDAVFHVRYLVQALEAQDAGVMERYARWLQGLLVPRGMSSRHIATHFQGLYNALVREGLTQPPEALEYVRAAETALEWPEGPARAVHLALPRLVPQTLGELATREGTLTRGQEIRLGDELLLQLSYLMDSLGARRPGLFVEHVQWYAGFWPRRDLRCSYRGLLEALEAALARDVSLSDLPRVTVATGLTALEKEQS